MVRVSIGNGLDETLQPSCWSGFAVACGLRSGLKLGDNFLAITSTACAILESSARSLFTLAFVMAP
jgi:hypothetical protein